MKVLWELLFKGRYVNPRFASLIDWCQGIILHSSWKINLPEIWFVAFSIIVVAEAHHSNRFHWFRLRDTWMSTLCIATWQLYITITDWLNVFFLRRKRFGRTSFFLLPLKVPLPQTTCAVMPKIYYTRFPVTFPQTRKLPTCYALVTGKLV